MLIDSPGSTSTRRSAIRRSTWRSSTRSAAHGDAARDDGGGACARSTRRRRRWRRAALDERTRAEREEFLRFQLKELDEARLEPGEDERLKLERERLRAAEQAAGGGAARRGRALLRARGAIVEELGGDRARARRSSARSIRRSDALGKQIDEARVLLEDAARDLRRYAEQLDADPERLAEVDERARISSGKLLRKHRRRQDVAG